jgi:hypothetical protein
LQAALCLAIDLGPGQPLEHLLRSCLIAIKLADLVGADAAQREMAYYAGPLAWIGCHADSQEFAELLGNDIEFRAASHQVDWRGTPGQAESVVCVRVPDPVTGAPAELIVSYSTTTPDLLECRAWGTVQL